MRRSTKLALAAGSVLAAIGLFLFLVFDIYIAATNAMEPTIAENERLVAQARLFGTTDRGDVVIVQIPGEPLPRVSRVVAVGGDTIAGRDGGVWRNGTPIPEPYVAPGVITSPFAEVVVPADHVFLLSDNRPLGKDSRFYGPVPVDYIQGIVVLRLWPVGGV